MQYYKQPGDGSIPISTSFKWYLAEAFFYLGGLFLYAKRIPEKWFPKKLDYLGTSHQIFHVGTVLGALSHYQGTIIDYYNRIETICPVS